MNELKPIVLRDGKLSNLNLLTEEIQGAPDFHSGYSVILEDRTVKTGKQMVNFIMLTMTENLTLDGDLWLA